MIQFNLLPDIKLQYIKTTRMKRFAIMTSMMVAGATFAIFFLLFVVVSLVQTKQMSNLEKDIKEKSSELESFTDLNKVLTVQNQLRSLPDLHKKKPVSSRIIAYIQQVTPARASIADLKVNFVDNTITISGAANSLSTVNKFADTLKFTTFKAGDSEGKAFTAVVLTSFGRDEETASYDISVTFDPKIFDSANTVNLIVPKIITTRSETEKPSDKLFEPLSNTQGQGQ